MKKILKITLAVLLFGCLAKLPYGYYQFIRVAVCAGFIWLIYDRFDKENIVTILFCTSAIILFNPIFKIHFKRPIWNTIDIAYGIGLVIWIVIDLVYLYHGKRKEASKTQEGTGFKV